MSKRQLFNGVVNRIAGIGIELEGGWDAPVEGHTIVRDGSVKFVQPKMRRTIDPQTGLDRFVTVQEGLKFPKYEIGEIVSPGPRNGGPLTINNFADWLRRCYPQHVNETCGLHVHMSFYTKLNYSRLLTEDYMLFVIESLKNWGRKAGIPEDHMFWSRLDPTHPWTQQHCAHQFLGENQITINRKDFNSRGTPYSRYTFINYCHAQHNTLECRGLPMFSTADESIAAVGAVLDATNRYLSKMRLREKKFIVDVAVQPDLVQEFRSIIR
jgi:hypothetical protein